MQKILLLSLAASVALGLAACKERKLKSACTKVEMLVEEPEKIEYGKPFTISAKLDNPDLANYYVEWRDPSGWLMQEHGNGPFTYCIYASDDKNYLDITAQLQDCNYQTREKQLFLEGQMPAPACVLTANTVKLDGQPEMPVTVTTAKDANDKVTVTAGDLELTFSRKNPVMGAYFANDPLIQGGSVSGNRLVHTKMIISGFSYAPMALSKEKNPPANVFLYDYNNGKRALIACDVPLKAKNAGNRMVSFHLLID